MWLPVFLLEFRVGCGGHQLNQHGGSIVVGASWRLPGFPSHSFWAMWTVEERFRPNLKVYKVYTWEVSDKKPLKFYSLVQANKFAEKEGVASLADIRKRQSEDVSTQKKRKRVDLSPRNKSRQGLETCKVSSVPLQEGAKTDSASHPTPEDVAIAKGTGNILLLKMKWASLILAGKKNLEIRSCNTQMRGTIGIACQNLLYGTVELTDSKFMTPEMLEATVDCHCCPLEEITYKKPHGWSLESPRCFSQPVPFARKRGQIVWCKQDVRKGG